MAAAEALRSRGAVVQIHSVAEEAAVVRWASECRGVGCVVSSPGIPPGHEAIKAARHLGLCIVSELSLGCALLDGRTKIVAVTGSKGKSSLVKLIADAFSFSGKTAVACGNYGLPVCAVAIRKEAPQFAIVECSSFQLELPSETISPDAAVLLNLSKDHLDRHGSMEAYLDAKLNLFAYQKTGALALIPAPSEDPSGVGKAFRARFPDKRVATFGCGADADFLADTPSGSYFDNPVLRPAAAAATAVLKHFGLDDRQVRNAFSRFEPLPHRMQLVAKKGDVLWIDNSKATSLAALEASLKMSRAPVLLLAGGRLKEPLSFDGEILKKNGVKAAFVFGECGKEMSLKWGTSVSAEFFPDLPTATRAASAVALEMGSATVLLAPGTASFDQFRSYAERGELFASIARAI